VDEVESLKAKWYVWYTKPRAEKKTRDRLEARGKEVFLPLRKELRQWSDRKKWVEIPLFSGYIFIKAGIADFEIIRFTEGILNFVRFEGKPAELREKEIDNIRLILSDPIDLEVIDILYQPGEKIKITSGPLEGLEGEIVNSWGSKKLAVRITQLGKVVLVQLPKAVVIKTS
jgi:transcriptional antiterminator RfaH